ncbi:MAG: hypothetical protein IJQ85_05645 [Selenomonadaceae bacterium]|nr:hypothetical protein [Selenomonadaceae bacterium]
MQKELLKQLQTWAQAGDGDCAYKLATIYRTDGDFKNYVEWLEKSAATKNFDAMKEYAEYLREGADYEKALAIYKELAETFCDEESMENIVDMYEQGQGDKDTLIFVLKLIDKCFNEIYPMNNFARVFVFQTYRYNECTWEYLQAVERRRIAARIRKILAEN